MLLFVLSFLLSTRANNKNREYHTAIIIARMSGNGLLEA